MTKPTKWSAHRSFCWFCHAPALMEYPVRIEDSIRHTWDNKFSGHLRVWPKNLIEKKKNWVKWLKCNIFPKGLAHLLYIIYNTSKIIIIRRKARMEIYSKKFEPRHYTHTNDVCNPQRHGSARTSAQSSMWIAKNPKLLYLNSEDWSNLENG